VRSYLADELHERKVSERLLELVTEVFLRCGAISLTNCTSAR
jgi:hypothetical protein